MSDNCLLTIIRLEQFKGQDVEEEHPNEGRITSPNGLDWSCVKQYMWPKFEKYEEILHLAPMVITLQKKREGEFGPQTNTLKLWNFTY